MSGSPPTKLSRGVWSDDEHERFLEGLRLFPNGPWIAIAERVGTRSVRQVQTHAVAVQERTVRHLRELHQEQELTLWSKNKINQEMKATCQTLPQYRVPASRSSVIPDPIDELTTVTLSYFDYQPEEPTFDECLDFLIESLVSNSAECDIEGHRQNENRVGCKYA